jgi:hypothetical protein
VEDADPTLLPNMVANWVGLAPEERWWLYTTINATAGHPEHGRDRGWRKAIKVAFAENPAGAPPASLAEHLPPIKEDPESEPIPAAPALPKYPPEPLPAPVPELDSGAGATPPAAPRRRAQRRAPLATQATLPLNGR